MTIIDDVTTPYEPLYVMVSVIVGFRNISNVKCFPTINVTEFLSLWVKSQRYLWYV